MNTYTLIASYYDEVMDEHLYNIYLDVITRYLKPPILEVGSGTGLLSRKLSASITDIDAIDNVQAMINKAKSYTTSVNFFIHDITKPLNKNYNLIIAPVDVINHFDFTTLYKVLSNIDHALNINGLFIFDMLNKPYFDSLINYQETLKVKNQTLNWSVKSIKENVIEHHVSDQTSHNTHKEYYHDFNTITDYLTEYLVIETIPLEDRLIIVMKKKKNKHS